MGFGSKKISPNKDTLLGENTSVINRTTRYNKYYLLTIINSLTYVKNELQY